MNQKIYIFNIIDNIYIFLMIVSIIYFIYIILINMTIYMIITLLWLNLFIIYFDITFILVLLLCYYKFSYYWFIILFSIILLELRWTPYKLENESELVCGNTIEISRIIFTMLFLFEYTCAIVTIIFLSCFTGYNIL
jgi:hypothetical protein